MTLKRIAPALTALVLLSVFSGCAEKTDKASTDQAAGDASLSPNSPDLIEIKGWTGVEIGANSATTTINQSGHYLTDHNLCTHKAEGVYDVATWNSLVTTLNTVAITAPMSTHRCVDSPSGSKFYNKGTVDLMPVHGAKRSLFEYKNGQICSSISDVALSNSLMDLIEKTILLADRAEIHDCPGHEHD
jgi:hypothetical protein